MKVSIDTYSRPQASKSANRYPSQATIFRSPVGTGSYRLSIDLEPIVQGVLSTVVSRFALVAVYTAVKAAVSCIIATNWCISVLSCSVYNAQVGEWITASSRCSTRIIPARVTCLSLSMLEV